MAEIKFIIKVFVICSVLLIALQFEVKGQKMEVVFTQYLRHGHLTMWVKEAVSGVEQLARKTVKELPQSVSFKADNKSKVIKKVNVSSDIPVNSSEEADFPENEITTVNLNDVSEP